jgi:hypothetical protein
MAMLVVFLYGIKNDDSTTSYLRLLFSFTQTTYTNSELSKVFTSFLVIYMAPQLLWMTGEFHACQFIFQPEKQRLDVYDVGL